MFARLRWRLVAANVLVIAAILAALGGAVLVLMDRLLVDQQAATLRTRASEASAELRFDPRDFVARRGTFDAGTFYVLWDASGTLVAETANVPTDVLRPVALAALSAAGGTGAASPGAGASTPGDAAQAPASEVRLGSADVLVVSVLLDDGQGVLQAGASLDPVRDAERQVTILVALAGLAGLALAVLAGWFLAGRSMVPIRRAFDRQREFIADASHELRTPLAVVDAGLQVLERHDDQPIRENADVVHAMREQVDRMARLVSALLTLARADAGAAEIRPSETDLDALVRRVAATFGPLADREGAAIEVTETAAGTARVDPDRVAELLGILVDNALRHARVPGRPVRVTLSARRAGGQVDLVVADDGPGIPATDRPRVLERFGRGDASRTGEGFGLGLAIAQWIAGAHGGRLLLEDNAPGLRVRVELPVT